MKRFKLNNLKSLVFFVIFFILILSITACNYHEANVTVSKEKAEYTVSEASTSSSQKHEYLEQNENENTKNLSSKAEAPYEYIESEDYKKLKSINTTKLQISSKGEEFIDATPELARMLLAIFKNYYEISLDSPHGLEIGYINTDDYLYVFRFQGLKDIKVLPNSSFIFVGSDKYIYEDNSLSILLEALKYMKKQKINDIPLYKETKGIIQPFNLNNYQKTYNSIKEDLNGDGKKEKLEIYFNGELSIWIDGKKHLIDCDNVLYYVNMQDRKAFRKSTLVPKVCLYSKSSSKEKLIVVSFEHHGADNFHEEFYTMKYTNNNELKQYKLTDTTNIDSILENDQLVIKLSDYDIESKMKLDYQTYKDICEFAKKNNKTPEETFTGKNIFYLIEPQGFEIKNIDSDAQNELILLTSIKTSFNFYLAQVKILYELKNDNWIPTDFELIKV